MNKKLLKKHVSNFYWSIYGRTISNPKLPLNIKSILFVCKGNICRSPFAEYFASKYISVANPLLYYSAGIQVDYPKPPPLEAIVSARNFEIDLNGHMSREINYTLMEEYDLITVMETWQYNNLRRIFKEFRSKICLLPLFERHEGTSCGSYNIYNIKDPYGKNVSEFDECFRKINSCLTGLFLAINDNNKLA